MQRFAAVGLMCIALSGCNLMPRETSSGAITRQLKEPPARAAACFARNAENHSSALVAEVGRPDARGNVQVVVRVRNGVLYAQADLRPAGTRSEAVISLNVTSVRGTAQLVDTLVDGC